MLKKRIIPKLLLKNSKNNIPCLVNSFKFEKYKIIGSPTSQAKIFEAQLADQLILLNIDSLDLKLDNPLITLLKEFSHKIFMPLIFGGGIKNLRSIEILLKNGADKISLNTSAVLNSSFIKHSSRVFGSQCIVISIDYKYNGSFNEVYITGGKQSTGLNLFDWAEKVQELGAGEIVLCDINRDGTSKGLDIKAIKEVTKIINIPVIASGGCGLAEHFVDCFKKTGAQGISAGNFFSNKDQNIFQTRSQIINSGIPLRKI